MNPRPLVTIATAILALAPAARAGPARAQDDDEVERVALRVISSESGVVLVDRGERDGVAVGDAVLLHPRGDAPRVGRVARVDERTAVVRMRDRGFAPAPGVRGEVLIPAARLEERRQEREEAERGKPPAEPPGTPAPREHAPWTRGDDGWTPDMPLLSGLKPLRPEERARNVSGRVYVIADLVYSTVDDFDNSIYRTGTDLVVENPFGRGGAVHFGGEVDYKTDIDDDTGADLFLDRLSYSRGGTRFAPTRWEVGRFLQFGMPEFGILDGFEWGRRRENGDRYGASIGALPELDHDFETGDDFQVAAYYHWAVDEQERLNVSGGFQKTVHHGDSDRDLFVGKVRYLPVDGWDVHATAWVDFYGSSSDDKPFAELTQGLASLRRVWDTGDGVDLTYRHQAFPELDRNEFAPGIPELLTEAHYDRIALGGWQRLGSEHQVDGEIGWWIDEDDAGGDASLGVDVHDLLLDGSRTTATVFGVRGKFSLIFGGRLSYGRFTNSGGWEVRYSYSNHHEDGFSSGFDDIAQHRLRATRSFFTRSGWNLSVYGEGYLFDRDGAWSAGVHLQKIF